jgi:hypothetical protein
MPGMRRSLSTSGAGSRSIASSAAAPSAASAHAKPSRVHERDEHLPQPRLVVDHQARAAHRGPRPHPSAALASIGRTAAPDAPGARPWGRRARRARAVIFARHLPPTHPEAA